MAISGHRGAPTPFFGTVMHNGLQLSIGILWDSLLQGFSALAWGGPGSGEQQLTDRNLTDKQT
jgi:hypothetical protein